MATRFTAAAVTIALVGGVLGAAGAAGAAGAVGAVGAAVSPSGAISFSVVNPTTAPRPVVTVADAPSTGTGGTLLGLPAFATGPIRFDLAAGTVDFPVFPTRAQLSRSTVRQAHVPRVAPAPKPQPGLPFHRTAKKAVRLPATGVPMSAALGTVTALTALLAGLGTVVAARRRGDRSSESAQL